jgi:hypothetical protein
MLLRIDLVLSAILGVGQPLVNSPKVLASVSRRFSRCFSCAGGLPFGDGLLGVDAAFRAPRPARCRPWPIAADGQRLAPAVETVVVAEGDRYPWARPSRTCRPGRPPCKAWPWLEIRNVPSDSIEAPPFVTAFTVRKKTCYKRAKHCFYAFCKTFYRQSPVSGLTVKNFRRVLSVLHFTVRFTVNLEPIPR